MKWIRTIVVFDRGNLIDSSEWAKVHEGYVEAITAMVHPPGSESFTIRRKVVTWETSPAGKKKKKEKRNGVKPMREQFARRLKDSGWKLEEAVTLRAFFDSLGKAEHGVESYLKLFPSKEEYKQTIENSPGDFDCFLTTPTGKRAVIEWETGNISSSHRSLNKLCLSLMAEQIDMGVLIVPSRSLYEHVTDRIGNIDELSPYLPYWNKVGALVKQGLLAVTVVEHDHLTDDEAVPYLKQGDDGRSAEAQVKLAIPD